MSKDLVNSQYIDYVVDTLNSYKHYSDKLVGGGSQIYPEDLQYALANYQSIKFGLTAELQRRMSVLRTTKRLYEKWWNEKVASARKELLSSMPSGKFPALKEYSIKAQEDNVEEYNDWQQKLQEAGDKYDFLKMLKSDWDSFQFILTTLNSNMVSELKSLHLDRVDVKVRKRLEE